ncbi:MAG: cysteine--tRNA ligase, partial [Candidatus Humimicrobiaceae bacterium]
MALKVYDTLTRRKELFVPSEEKKVKMYVCGPTVYNFISIGNARPIIVFNMVRNYLRYLGYKVLFVQNITDIEDKIINKANAEGVDFKVITERYTKAFMEDLDTL